MPARRDSHSAATSAASEIAIATSTRRPAAASPFGHLGEGVDGGRDRLRLARNVGHEGDGGAELAERLGEAEHDAGDEAGQRERQGHGQEHPEPLAPSVAAASSRRLSMASIASRIGRTMSGKPMIPQASAAPVQRNENTMPSCRPGRRRSARAGRTRSAADSRSRPAAAPAADAPGRRAGSCPRTTCAPAATPWRCRTAAPPGSPRRRSAATAGSRSIHREKGRATGTRWAWSSVRKGTHALEPAPCRCAGTLDISRHRAGAPLRSPPPDRRSADAIPPESIADDLDVRLDRHRSRRRCPSSASPGRAG